MTINIPTLVSQTITNGVTAYAPSEDAVFDALALKQPLDADLTSIAGLAATEGYLRKTAANTWEADTVLTKQSNSIGINSTAITAGLEIKEKSASTAQPILSVVNFSNNNQFQVSENDIIVFSNGGLFGLHGLLALGSGSPINLTGTTSNLNVLDVGSVVYLEATGAQDLTGIMTGSGNNEGSIIYLFNSGITDIITLKNNTTSIASNRFDFYPTTDVALNPKEVVGLIYLNGRWRLRFKVSASAGNALTSNPLSQFASTTSAQLAGVISDETGTDKLVFNTSPTFATQTSTTAITATTASNDVLQTLTNNSSGTPAASYGLSRLIQLKSSTTDSQIAGKEIWSWTNATHANRQSGYKIQAVGNASVGTLQDVFRIKDNGNSFQFDFVNHAGYDAKLTLYSGTTHIASFQGAGNDIYISTINSASAGIHLRPGGSTEMFNLTTTGLFLGGSTNPTALCHIAAGTTAKAQMKFESSTAPTAPNNGDLWFDGTDLKIRVSGVTYTLTKA